MKMTKEYILSCLDKYCNFDGALHQDNFFENIIAPLSNNVCFENWTYDNGASKVVLIFSGLNFVIKIPFTGQTAYEVGHYEDERGDWHYSETAFNSRNELLSNIHRVEGEEFYEEYNGAGFVEESGGWDYCMAEALKYKKAVAAGLDIMFAKTELIGRVGVNDFPIYAQERCNMFQEEFSSTNKEKYHKRTKQDYDKLRSLREQCDCYILDDDWLLDFVLFYGEESLKILADFCFKWNIDDLHSGNIGYHNGVPCLVDYSGFCS